MNINNIEPPKFFPKELKKQLQDLEDSCEIPFKEFPVEIFQCNCIDSYDVDHIKVLKNLDMNTVGDILLSDPSNLFEILSPECYVYLSGMIENLLNYIYEIRNLEDLFDPDNFFNILISSFSSVSQKHFVIKNQGICVDRFGKNFTLEKIGDSLNITRERVRQIESKFINQYFPKISQDINLHIHIYSIHWFLNEKLNLDQYAIFKIIEIEKQLGLFFGELSFWSKINAIFNILNSNELGNNSEQKKIISNIGNIQFTKEEFFLPPPEIDFQGEDFIDQINSIFNMYTLVTVKEFVDLLFSGLKKELVEDERKFFFIAKFCENYGLINFIEDHNLGQTEDYWVVQSNTLSESVTNLISGIIYYLNPETLEKEPKKGVRIDKLMNYVNSFSPKKMGFRAASTLMKRRREIFSETSNEVWGLVALGAIEKTKKTSEVNSKNVSDTIKKIILDNPNGLTEDSFFEEMLKIDPDSKQSSLHFNLRSNLKDSVTLQDGIYSFDISRFKKIGESKKTDLSLKIKDVLGTVSEPLLFEELYKGVDLLRPTHYGTFKSAVSQLKGSKQILEKQKYFSLNPSYIAGNEEKTWDKNYSLLKKYSHYKYSHYNYEKDGSKLGEWVSIQRIQYKSGKLPQDRIEKLESLGFKWESEHRANRWDKNYSLLKEFYIENAHVDGHVDISLNNLEKCGFPFQLYHWAKSQRIKYKSGELPQDRIEKLESLGFKWEIDRIEQRWDKNYSLLKEFYIENGHVDVSYNYEKDGFRLGEWVSSQRIQYKSGNLSQDRIEKLESLGFKWGIDHIEQTWDKKYSLLKDFYIENGHVDVSYTWAKSQRIQYKSGNLSQDRIEKLESLGFKWEIDPPENQWEEMYLLLKKYSPYNYGEKDGSKLGEWISIQRIQYKSRKLPQDRIEKLESLGFKWEIDPSENQWEAKYLFLKQYHITYGHIDVPDHYSQNENTGVTLRKWVIHQRIKYKSGELPQDRIEKLESLGFKWEIDPSKNQWKEMYPLFLLKEFDFTYDHVDVPYNYEKDGFRLGEWVSNQKIQYKSGKLSQGRIEKLESLGFKWEIDPPENQWEEMYLLLKKYSPYNYGEKDGSKLGEWISSQRIEYKSRKLPQGRIEKLESLGFKWEIDPSENQWEEIYLFLEDFHLLYNHVDVPYTYETKDGVKLGQWLIDQTNLYKSGKLSQGRIDKLESLGVEWVVKRIKQNWGKRFSLLKDFHILNGHVNVPYSYETKQGVKLGEWVKSQRIQYKSGTLSQYRIDKLESLGVEWV